jgi:hypothetical protein
MVAALEETEQPLLRAATDLLSECLEVGSGRPCPVGLSLVHAMRSDFLTPVGPGIPDEIRRQGLVPASRRDYGGFLYESGKRIVVLSLLGDVLQPALRHRREGYLFLPLPAWQRNWTPAQHAWVADHFVPEPVIALDAAAAHWRAICSAILQTGASHVFLCNVFRRVPGIAHRYYETPESPQERIQKFNLLAAEVSQDTGACVVDLDRSLADLGGRLLKTDYRLTGAAAAGADTVVSTLFRAGLDDYVTEEAQQKAAAQFEVRRAATGWFSLQDYRLKIIAVVTRFQELAQQSPQLSHEGAQRMGRFLLFHAAALAKRAPPGNLALHRRVVAALGETGQGYVDFAQAVLAGDVRAQQRAVQRFQTGGEQLRGFWKAFDEFCRQNTRSIR